MTKQKTYLTWLLENYTDEVMEIAGVDASNGDYGMSADDVIETWHNEPNVVRKTFPNYIEEYESKKELPNSFMMAFLGTFR